MSHTKNAIHLCPAIEQIREHGYHVTVHCVSYVCDGKVVHEWTKGLNGKVVERNMTECMYCGEALRQPNFQNQVIIE